MSSCILNDTIAGDRKTLFANYKLEDCRLPNGDDEDKDYPIDVNKFLALLILFRDSPKGYSGMRVYFATCPDQQEEGVPDGRAGHMTLIVAATLETSIGPTKYEFDDPGSYYHLYDQCLPLDPYMAAAWIRHFESDRRPDLIDKGRDYTGNNNFVETTSLWYPMSTIKGAVDSSGDGDIGMIAALNCGLGKTPTPVDNPIVGMSAGYACFLQREQYPTKYPYYQLTVNFILHQKNDGDPFHPLALGSTSVLGLSDADTGLPCPPAGSCPPPGGGFGS
jgi:hypothetical protein